MELIILFEITPIVLTVINIRNLFMKKKFIPNLTDGLIIILGPLFTYLFYGVLSMRDYHLPLRNLSDGDYHTPLASWHISTIITLAFFALVGYALIRIMSSKLPPFLIVLSISMMLIGFMLSVAWALQLYPHYGDVIYFYLFPANYIICCYTATRKTIVGYTDKIQTHSYNSPILRICSNLLHRSKNWPILSVILVLPILLIILSILILFGQQPDAAIKAFTETSDWFFSQKTSPPPIVNEKISHYLCTVSLKGHPSIVKPIRLGVRQNEKIVLNRQLCIANAFEQLIQIRTPRFHRFIRHVYNKYGYPLSKLINSKIAADIVYLLMKPLEWLFLITLYLFDKEPENRIAMQYLPINALKK